MNNTTRPRPLKLKRLSTLNLVILLAALLPAALLVAAEGTGEKPAKTEKPATQKAAVNASSKTNTPSLAAKQLTGAELYSMHCNRCHPERYPTERTAAQWKTILLHMRVRANLPAEQARTILRYLQDNSGR